MAGRAQSTIIGFVLLFGILVMLLLTLQTSAVPAWNQGVEVSHNDRVGSDMELFRDGIFRAAATGSPSSQSISLGTQYPLRPFLLNPPDPSGRIRTTAVGKVRITNATAAGETGHYWDRTTRTFDSRAVVYEPNYNEYRNAPTTVFENGVLYNRYEERPVTQTGARLVNGRRITIVTVNGSLSLNGQRSRSVDIEPLSAPQQATTVESDGPLVITAPTRLPESTWQELLAEEDVDADGYVTDVSVTPGDPGQLRVTLEANRSYDLRMAKVGVGSQLSDPPAHYITTDSPETLRLTEGETERVTFEVRDRYNNPVSGEEVDATVSPELGTLTPVDNVTGSDGQAVFQYEAVGTGTTTIEAAFGPEAQRDRQRTATVTVESSATRTADDRPLALEWTAPSEGADGTYSLDAGDSDTVDLTVTSSPAVGGLDVEYVVDNPSVGTVDPIEGTTNESGKDTTTFTATDDGTVTVYAVGGGDVDELRITVANLTATAPPVVDTIEITDESQTRGGNKYAQFTIDYAVSGDTELANVRVRAVREDGTQVFDDTRNVSGTSISGSATFRDDDQTAQVRGTSYDVTVIVTDSNGQTERVERTVTVA